MRYFTAIDFDGTITDVDVVDSIIEEFAESGWEAIEELWLRGAIGSAECLRRQVALINAPVITLLDYVDSFKIDPHFSGFVNYLREKGMPFAIVSDGFRVLIERILNNAGIGGIPSIYANDLVEADGRLVITHPHSAEGCPSGTCKCMAMRNAGLPVRLIGDGHSDFCAAREASMVFSKGELSRYCRENAIQFYEFDSFKDIEDFFVRFELEYSL
jgi:2,3-diketo-5-methylthio-1-phosphopentane phosphatase